jgi:hypothetical protein
MLLYCIDVLVCTIVILESLEFHIYHLALYNQYEKKKTKSPACPELYPRP